ncbi:methyltransferase [Massilia sp. KIM]|nr:methyltransferase [Massilia sp. KIM]
MACIVCGATQVAGLAQWHQTCPGCRYESAMLTGAINGQNGLAPDEAERERGLKALRQENFEVIVRYAMRHARPGARRLLDVGSAHGWFLEIARKQFQVLGIEPDEAVGKRAAARGLPVRTGYFPDALADGERFDIIVFNDVIEHIPDIHSALASCHERLDEGGILILNIPSSRGFFYRLSKLLARVGWRAPFERLWQKDLPSPHVHYFNPGNLRQLVAGQGFELADATELPALRAQGLLERMRCTGDMGPVMLYAQYLAILCLIPVLRMFPSDIIVGVFRKKAAD